MPRIAGTITQVAESGGEKLPVVSARDVSNGMLTFDTIAELRAALVSGLPSFVKTVQV